MAGTSVLQFPKTPNYNKAIRVYNRMNKSQYLIGFVDDLDRVIYYKYENGQWTEEKTLSRDKNERLSDEIKVLLDKLSANDVHTFTLDDVSDPDKATPEDLEPGAVNESDILYKITTFIVEKKETGYSSSVTVKPTINYPDTRFTKYTHEPKTKPCQKSLVMFKGKKLFRWDSSQSKLLVINDVQDKNLNNIDVYFSDTIDFPLLAGVFQSNNTTEYYFVKRNADRLSWQLLDQVSLKDFIGDTITNKEIHTKLTERNNQRLIKLLNKIALSVVDTVLVLVDKREAYNRTVASDAYKTTLGTKADDFTISDFQPESINVTSVDVPSLKLSNFKCFEHTIMPNGTGPYQTKLLIPFKHFSIVSNKTVYSYRYFEVELYKNDNINDSNKVDLTFKNGEIKLYVYYYCEDPRPLLMCYENKVYRTKRLGDPERYTQVNIKYNQWSILTNIDGCDPELLVRNPGSEANDQKILEALIDVVQYFNPVTLNSEKLPKESTKDFTEGKADTSKYLIHDLTSNCKIYLKISSSEMATYRIHTYEHNGLENQNDSSGFTLGDVIFKGTHGGYNAYKVNYATAIQGQPKKMRHLVKVSAYFHKFDSDFQDPLLVILEFKDGTTGTANTTEYYKLTVRSNEVPGTMNWDKDDSVAGIIDDQKRLLEFLNNVRYNLKYSAKMQLHFTRPSYPFLALNHEGTTEYTTLSGTETSITVSKESCSELEKKGFKCYRQAISSVKTIHLYYITALKMSLPVRNKKDAIIQLFDETGQNPLDKLFYDYAYGDVYVYYYRNYNHPLMFCLKGSAFRPYDNNSYFSKWVKVNQIQKCDYTTLSTEEINQLEKILTLVVHFIGLDKENDNQRAKNILNLTIDDECINYMPDTLRISVLDKSDFILDTFKRDRATNNHRKLILYEFDDIWPGYYYNITSWNYGKFGEYVGYAQTLISCAISNLKHYGYHLHKFPEGIYSHRVEWYKKVSSPSDIVILVHTNTLFIYKFRIEYRSGTWKNDTFKYRVSTNGYYFIGVEPVTPLDRQELYSIYCERVKFINKLDFDSSDPTRPKTSKEALDYFHA
ncbi:hypothetical protein MACK_003140 [Theileria orientalis]|uniref:Uncharacterized protein n=1 Tax=Theileria orientalis TaxID=68886 RepID=A0A976QVH9_THEOR|nr:hypothetical protein MACK_003140 [Theileria orientalis]